MTILGTVDIRDIDLGCMLTLGAEIIQYTIDGGQRAQYVMDIAGIDSDLDRFQGKVPVFFDRPEDSYQDWVLPSFVFSQTGYSGAFERMPYAGTVARGAARDAEVAYNDDGEQGYTKYVTQVRADPYDVSFDLMVYARRRQELNIMVKHVMSVMRPPWFSFKIIDSLNDVRHYDAGDMSFSNASELADIADRTKTWTVSFTVRGEIDTFDDVVSSAMIDPRSDVQIGVS